jgi:microsomal dipeptidase-like Zn-dependent dipeptidase
MKVNAVALMTPAVVVALVAASACQGDPDQGPPACAPITFSSLQLDVDAGADADAGVPVPIDSQTAACTQNPIVWGFADLHAHPAIDVAFGNRLVWGTALDPAPVNASELPVIDSCPVETHDHNASSPIDHVVGGVVFPMLSDVAHFAHAPVGDLSVRPTRAWPNARDVIHQGMNVSSIRRAYEAGLRLMFASTTDDQVLSAVLAGPNFINGFVPDPHADYVSAKTQLQMIETMVEQNRNWMDIADSPAKARSIIGHGKLALVMSLEMEGLEEHDFATLVTDFAVRHIIPVHLIDNDVGGTAVNLDLFNTASAAVSELYRKPDGLPMQFMDVAPTTEYGRKIGWPQTIATFDIPVYANLGGISLPWYKTLGYQALDGCNGQDPVAATSFIELGQKNFRGLCTSKAQCQGNDKPGKSRIESIMGMDPVANDGGQGHVFVDVSHMGYRSVADTLDVSPDGTGTTPPPVCQGAPSQPWKFPVVASHGDFTHICDKPCLDTGGGGERSLDGAQAVEIASRGGVLGLGLGVGTYGSRTVLDARGGPLLTFQPGNGNTNGCVAVADSKGTVVAPCVPTVTVRPVDAGMAPHVISLQVQTLGGIALDSGDNSRPFARIEVNGYAGYQHRVFLQPLVCTTEACQGSVNLGCLDAQISLREQWSGDVQMLQTAQTPQTWQTITGGTPLVPLSTFDKCATNGAAPTIDDIDSVQLEWMSPSCNSSTGGSWTIEQADLTATTEEQGTVSITHLGPRPSSPVAQLDSGRGGFTLYDPGDRPGTGADLPASGFLFKISLQSSGDSQLVGANTDEVGANVCAALRHWGNGNVCEPAPGLDAGATECPTQQGWVALNQRGTWAPGRQLYAFARSEVGDRSICGVDVAVLDWDASSSPWSLDQIRVETVEDPVGHFIQRYAQISKYAAGGQMGTVTFGTDANGLNGLMDISEYPMPSGTLAASSCAITGDAGPTAPAQPMAPMRLRHADGGLGDPVLIEERGLATYGLLGDMMGIIRQYPGCGADVYESLMLSAEATLRAWEAMDPKAPRPAPLPKASFACGHRLDPPQ